MANRQLYVGETLVIARELLLAGMDFLPRAVDAWARRSLGCVADSGRRGRPASGQVDPVRVLADGRDVLTTMDDDLDKSVRPR